MCNEILWKDFQEKIWIFVWDSEHFSYEFWKKQRLENSLDENSCQNDICGLEKKCHIFIWKLFGFSKVFPYFFFRTKHLDFPRNLSVIWLRYSVHTDALSKIGWLCLIYTEIHTGNHTRVCITEGTQMFHDKAKDFSSSLNLFNKAFTYKDFVVFFLMLNLVYLSLFEDNGDILRPGVRIDELGLELRLRLRLRFSLWLWFGRGESGRRRRSRSCSLSACWEVPGCSILPTHTPFTGLS